MRRDLALTCGDFGRYANAANLLSQSARFLLDPAEARQIVDLMLAKVAAQLKEKAVNLQVTDEAKDLLGDKGFDTTFGARPLRRVIQNMVEDQLSEMLLRSEFSAGDTVQLERGEGDRIIAKVVSLAKQPSA